MKIKHGWSPGKNAKYFEAGAEATASAVTPNLDSSDVSIFIA